MLDPAGREHMLPMQLALAEVPQRRTIGHYEVPLPIGDSVHWEESIIHIVIISCKGEGTTIAIPVPTCPGSE